MNWDNILLLAVAAIIILNLILLLLAVKILSNVKEKSASPAKKSESIAAPAFTQGIPDEIVAVIAAAVSAMGDQNIAYAVRSIRPEKGGRPVWSTVGLTEITRPF